MKRITAFIIGIVLSTSLFAAPWTPSTVLEPNHPRILFTHADSAAISARITTTPFSSYYSTIWSRANSTSGNSTQAEDFSRSAIAMSAAFVLYFGKQPSGDTLTTSQRTALQAKALDYLNNMLTNIEGSIYDNSNYHYPCERLIQYSVAYDILCGAGISADSSRIRSLANTIYNGATTWLITYVVDDISLFMNHKLIVAGALGCAAVAIPSDGGQWINYSMCKINKVAFTDESDTSHITGFAEGPHYFKYAMEHLLQFFMGMKQYCGDITDYYSDPCGGEDSGWIRSFYFHPGWDKIYLWASLIRLPNGKMPPLDDTFRNDGICHTAPFAQRDEQYFWGASGFGSRMLLQPMLVAVGAEPCPLIPPGTTALPYAGNLIFRSSPDNGNLYVHILGENGRANTNTHNQADEASFYISAFGEDIALDPGYVQYSLRDTVNGCTKHNMILVNNVATSTLTPVNSYISKAFELPGIYYGEVATFYQSSNITRSMALLDERFILIIDDLSRSSSATYTYQCHGMGKTTSGSFTETSIGGIWTGGDTAAMILAVDAIDGPDGFTYDTSAHEISYNTWGYHSVARCRKTATNTKFISVLYPFRKTAEPMQANAIRLTEQATLRFGAESKEGIFVARTDRGLLTFPEDSILPSLNGYGEAVFALFDSASNSIKNIYAINCDSLSIDGQRLFMGLSSPVDLGLTFEGEIIRGYLNTTASTIALQMNERPSSVIGATTWSWSSRLLTLELPDYAYFVIDATPLSVYESERPESPDIKAFPNPFNSFVEFYSPSQNLNKIEIFDVSGKIISTLYPEQLIWRPDRVTPSGVYLSRAFFRDKAVSQAVVVYLK